MIVVIEGNIGTGKTTLLKKLIETGYLENIFKERTIDYIFEPVDQWLNFKDNEGINVLDKFYTDIERYAFSFQWMAFMTRIKAIVDSSADIIIVERSVFTDKNVFVNALYESGKMTNIEWKIYCEWFNWILNTFKLRKHLFIYLKANPETSMDRIKNRGREEEKNISLEYLNILSIKHDEWLINLDNSIVIDYENDYKLQEKDFFEKYFKLISDSIKKELDI